MQTEGRKKLARPYKQHKVMQYNTPKAATSLKKNELLRVGFKSTTLHMHSRQNTLHYKNIRVISILPGLAQLHLFSDLQYYIIIIITPPATEAYIIILKTYTHCSTDLYVNNLSDILHK